MQDLRGALQGVLPRQTPEEMKAESKSAPVCWRLRPPVALRTPRSQVSSSGDVIRDRCSRSVARTRYKYPNRLEIRTDLQLFRMVFVLFSRHAYWNLAKKSKFKFLPQEFSNVPDTVLFLL